MDVINISSKTARSISQLNKCGKEGLGKVVKFFMQSLVKGGTNLQLGMKIRMNHVFCNALNRREPGRCTLCCVHFAC